MNNKDLKKLFLQETAKIDISMSEETKNTPIRTSKRETAAALKRKTPWLKAFLPITAFACCIILAITVLLPLQTINASSELTAYVVEINPAIAFVADENDNLINVCSVNEDADSILSNAEFGDISNMKLNDAIEKVIEITASEGIFDGYDGTIKIFALNDNEKTTDKKLDKFGEMVKKGLKDYGHSEIGFEKKPMKLDEFRNKMGFDNNFDKLDDMREDIKNHDRYKGAPPLPKDGNEPPPKPNGDNPPPEN